MSLKAAVEAQSVRKGSVCSVSLLRPKLSATDRADFDDMVYDPSIPCTVIARGLLAVGQDISADVLSRHRSKGCKCEPRI